MNVSAPAPIKLLPAYPIAEAARLLAASPSTLHAWFHGRDYKVRGAARRSPAVLAKTDPQGTPLSFLDLVEAHVLLAIRKGYKIPLSRFRRAMEYLGEISGDLHFLAHQQVYHDRRDLFLKIEDRLVSLSERGQHVSEGIIAEGLEQLEYGDDGYADRLFPRLAGSSHHAVVLDPRISYGQPCLARLGIKVDAVSARFRAGETIAEIARDYGAEVMEIEDAIRWVNQRAA